ncbi:glycosyltransferase family 4 protein [Frigoriglobus tundricola]|uniref:GT4 family glycosyltransferase n=1 Tax=Frigoriglobus tundricola TaxID=2774151 RepID=A0A6M5YHC4_9BACT|nr:glycosyltransferase family 1 protein [Frigoriglobus tundricola]QJW92710.1 GT4 family glycosyltransferase [Frigoriglobus tundricola]
MRVGIDIQFAAAGNRSGLYTSVRYLVRELRPLVNDRVLLLANGDVCHPPLGRSEYNELVSAFDGGSLRLFSPWRRLYRIAPRLSPVHRLDALVHNLHGYLPPSRSGANVYVVPDVIPLGFDYGLPAFVDGYRVYYEAAVRNAEAIIVWSEHTRGDLLARVGGDPARVHVCPLAVGPEFHRPDPDAMRAGLSAVGLADTRYVLCVSTIEKRKNHAVLLRAFERVIRRDPSLPHKLVFVGGKWVGHEAVFELAQSLGLGERFVSLGFSDHLPHIYAGADAFVFPSVYEGFGLPPLEAMACGTPVLAADATALPEVVGDAGLLFKPHDHEELAESLYRVLTDADLRRDLSQKGLARASKYSWRRTAELYLGAFQNAREKFRKRAAG